MEDTHAPGRPGNSKKGVDNTNICSVTIARPDQYENMPPKTTMSQSQESLRWVGVQADPAEEEKRIEVYKANRRTRYMATQDHLTKSLACPDSQ